MSKPGLTPIQTQTSWLTALILTLQLLTVSSEAATIQVFNAFWSSTADNDKDGCYAPSAAGSPMLLSWDVDEFNAPSATVFEKVYTRDTGTTNWTLLGTTTPHVIVGASTEDVQSFPVIPAGNCQARDYLIEVYEEGASTPSAVRDPSNDSDLAGHKEETFEDDMPPVTIYDASWSNIADVNQDGCIAPNTSTNLMRLHWDPDVVGGGSLSVFERIYARNASAQKWTLLLTTSPHTITGNTPADAQYADIPPGTNCTPTEYKIELYRVGESVPDYVRSAENDPDLIARPEQSFSQDTGPVIADAWWSNVTDRSQDGCVAPLTSGGLLRLNWDPNIAGGGTMLVFERIYRRLTNDVSWTLLQQTSPHLVSGNITTDAQYIDVPPGTGCAAYDYQIEIYAAGSTYPNSVRNQANDPDLAAHHEQSYAEDNAATSIADAWWTNVADRDSDGCFAPDKSSAYMHLNWLPQVAGPSSVNVFEKVLWRHVGETVWSLAFQTTPHLITGNSSNNIQFVVISPGNDCSAYDYRVELYRAATSTLEAARDPSNDPDLANHKEETWAQDNLLATVTRAWWSNAADNNLDGCQAPPSPDGKMRLNWESDVINGQTTQVYEKIYSRPAGTSTWTILTITQPHEVTGFSTNDSSFVEVPGATGCAAIDYRIEVFRAGNIIPDAFLDPSTEPALSAHKEQSYADDQPGPAIVATSWSNIADKDKDGCVAPASLHGSLRLQWQPDVLGIGSLSVSEKIFWRLNGATDWTLVATNAAHTITAGDTNNAQFADIQPHGNCQPGEYKIELYREGSSTPDYVRNAANDPNLANRKEEGFEGDNIVPVVLNPQWAGVADNDKDGCYAPNRPGQPMILTWDSRLSGPSQAAVFEKVWFRTTGDTNWELAVVTDVHQLTETNTVQSVPIPPASGCSSRDYRVEIYRADATEPDSTLEPQSEPALSAHKEELFTEDSVTVTLSNTWWSNIADQDQDGCIAPSGSDGYMRLNWDPDVVGNGALEVFEKLYMRRSGSNDWTLFATTATHVISGSTAVDAQHIDVVPAGGCTPMDYRIEIYRLGIQFPDTVHDASNDSTLSQHKEETYLEDTQVTMATISSTSWSNVADQDGDGCIAPNSPNGFLRLNWNPDVVGVGSLNVYEKVYWRQGTTGNWILVATTPQHQITENATADQQFVDLLPGNSCTVNQYKIEIYRLGNPAPDYTRDPSNDPGLSHKEESYSEDPGQSPAIVLQPKSQVVAVGSNVTFTVQATGSAPLSVQWFFQTTNRISGGTGLSLELRKAQTSDAGDYFAVITNAYGSVTSAVARLSFETTTTPPKLEAPVLTSLGEFLFNIVGTPGQVLQVESSSTLTNWTPGQTITNTTGTTFFSEPSSGAPVRFYRVRQIR